MQQTELEPTENNEQGVVSDRQEPNEQLENESAELNRWREGAEQFHNFWNTLSHSAKQELSPDRIGYLQALFLGERALTFNHIFSKQITDALADNPQFGFQTTDQYIYNPSHLRRIARKHPDIISMRSDEQPINYLDRINRLSDLDNSAELGVLLGFPEADTKFYQSIYPLYEGVTALMDDNLQFQIPLDQHDQTILENIRSFNGNFDDESKKILESVLNQSNNISSELKQRTMTAFDLMAERRHENKTQRTENVYGITWLNMDNSKETQQRIQTFRNAFEQSGILLPEQLKSDSIPNGELRSNSPESKQILKGEELEFDEDYRSEILEQQKENRKLLGKLSTVHFFFDKGKPGTLPIEPQVNKCNQLVSEHQAIFFQIFFSATEATNKFMASQMLPGSSDFDQVPQLTNEYQIMKNNIKELIEEAKRKARDAHEQLDNTTEQLSKFYHQ